jgi:hypothetical protein
MTTIQSLINEYETKIAQYEAVIAETQLSVLRTKTQAERRVKQDHIQRQRELMRQLQNVVNDLSQL